MHMDALTHLWLHEAQQRARALRRQRLHDPDDRRVRRLPGRLRLRLRLRRPWRRVPA
jgi:hypothetical protein